jgi:1-acyl-sn-glycerol-3-phosphate acyltransferase
MLAAFRSVLFNAFLAVYAPLSVLLMTLTLPFPRGVLMTLVRAWPRASAPLFRLLVGISHEFRGTENIPKEPCIIAAKHQSAWDTMGFYLAVDDAAYVLKKELLQLPFYGWCARKAGMIGVDRTGGAKALRAMVDDARAFLDAGRPVFIFPEGTRTRPGARVPYHPGVAALYTRLNVPVVPVALNSGLYWGRRSFVKRPGRIVVEFLPPIPPGLDRKDFMRELERRIEGASERLNAEALKEFPYLPPPEPAPPAKAIEGH